MKVSSSKKKKKFFSEENYPLAALFILTLFCVGLAVASINSSMTGNTVTNNVITGNAALDNPAPQIVIDITSWFVSGTDWKSIIISVIVLLIVFVGLYDILEITSFFSNQWVKLIIAAGISIIAAIVDVINNIASFMIQIAAGLGTIGVVLEIIVSIILFIGLSLGSNWIAKWSAKRKGQMEYVKAIKSSGEAGAAIRGLRELQQEFRKRK